MRSLRWVPIQCAWCVSKEMGAQTHTEGRPRPAVYTPGRDQPCAHLGLVLAASRTPRGYASVASAAQAGVLCCGRQNKHADPVRKREGVRTPSPVCVSIPCDGGGGGCPVFLWGKMALPSPRTKPDFKFRCDLELKFKEVRRRGQVYNLCMGRDLGG